MREIKFRAWDQATKDHWEPKPQGMIHFFIHNVPDFIGHTHNENGKWERRFIVEQFTGLTDKNGNEIYEGDIVGFKRYDYKSKEHDAWIDNEDSGIDDELENAIPMVMVDIDVVTMDRFPTFWLKNEKFGYEGELLANPSNYEILGNIHEHPHLLREQK